MNIVLISVLGGLLFTSLIGNACLIFFAKKIKEKKPQLTKDATSILRDLATGPALVKIEYVDRSEILLRSPRDY